MCVCVCVYVCVYVCVLCLCVCVYVCVVMCVYERYTVTGTYMAFTYNGYVHTLIPGTCIH